MKFLDLAVRGQWLASPPPQMVPFLILVFLPLPGKYFYQGGPEATGISFEHERLSGNSAFGPVVRTSAPVPPCEEGTGSMEVQTAFPGPWQPADPTEDQAFSPPSTRFLILPISAFFPIGAGYPPFLSTTHFPTVPHPASCPGA